MNKENGTADAQTITAYIHNAVQMADGDTALKKRVIELSNYLADEAIAAEKSRNAILYKVEEIESKKTNLISYRKNKQHTIILMAVLTILINLVLLHLMVWLLVERPLTRLTRSLYQINKGEILHIPYQNRRDRVGVLAGALKKFEDVLIQLRNDDLKKKVQRQTIQELIQQMSCMIETIQTKAQTMKKNAVELSILAGNTEEQTTNASESASRTVKQTNAVSHSTQKLQSAVQDIIGQLSKQNNLVGDINSVTQASREDMAQLNQASREISEIVSIVKNIAGQTKLLALNARIEAGRAGAAGKGFAVVARETRALCMQTEAANEKIENKITAIQKASKTIVQYTQQTDMRIERLMLAGHKISAAAEEQDTVTCGISKSADAAASDIKNVTKEIAKVNKAASATSRFAVSVQSYSEQIESQLSDLLKETREKLLTAGLTENLSSSIDMGAANDQL
ncbi:MAG: hypothetical protein HUK40_11790 [Desulfobacter sp.]|nr:hypothetical protein [Desulfobacter sp.]